MVSLIQWWSNYVGSVHLPMAVVRDEIGRITCIAYNVTSRSKPPWLDKRTRHLHETRCSQLQPEWRRIRARCVKSGKISIVEDCQLLVSSIRGPSGGRGAC